MKVITLCGSMRYSDQMKKIARDLEGDEGYCVLQPVYKYQKKIDEFAELQNIYASHNKKIEISDAIYVVNIDGYIGEATKNEIAFAKSKGKEIIYHEPIKG